MPRLLSRALVGAALVAGGFLVASAGSVLLLRWVDPPFTGIATYRRLEALAKAERGGSLRGASTLSQQTAKNLFLWPGRSVVRKGLEAYPTVLIETVWPKRRILAVYLKVVEFGDGVYGGGAAARRFFGVPPSRLSRPVSERP